MAEFKPVDKSKQLLIKRKGFIVTFKDMAGKRYVVGISQLRAMVFGGLKYIYANEYIPLPIGSNQYTTQAIKNKTKVGL